MAVALHRRLAGRLKIPFVVTPFVHLGDPENPDDRTRRAYLQPALLDIARSADRLFVQTEGERQALLDRGLPEERLVLQGMGVDPAECTGGSRQWFRAEWGLKPDEIVIGHLANNSEEKGTVDLLRAAELAWRRGCASGYSWPVQKCRTFSVFGRRTSRRRMFSVPWSSRTIGSECSMPELTYSRMPSRVDSFGLVLLEAWANGIPNVGYRAGGVPWVIRDKQDGLLVRCGDIEGLANALQQLAADSSLRRRLGAAGRDRLASDYRWQDKLDLVRQVYHELEAARLPH